MKYNQRDSIPNTPRNIRLDAGLKGSDVARLMDVSPAAASRFERGGSNARAATLALFYAACGRYDLLSYLVPALSMTDRRATYDVMRRRVREYGGPVVPAPPGFEDHEGPWYPAADGGRV